MRSGKIKLLESSLEYGRENGISVAWERSWGRVGGRGSEGTERGSCKMREEVEGGIWMEEVTGGK